VLFHDYTLVAGAGKTSNEEMKTYVKPYINSTLLEVGLPNGKIQEMQPTKE
jgi:hypothetical protein